MHIIIQLIFKNCTTKTCPLLWKYTLIRWTWWKTKSYKNFKVLKFWRKGLPGKLRIHFLPLGKITMFNGFKMFSFKCKSHMWKIILLENMFVCPLKLSLDFFWDFLCFWLETKILIQIMYVYEKSPPSHELS
jgi:hypothetical protein